jgi:hypothetical protein
MQQVCAEFRLQTTFFCAGEVPNNFNDVALLNYAEWVSVDALQLIGHFRPITDQMLLDNRLCDVIGLLTTPLKPRLLVSLPSAGDGIP